MLNCFSNYQHTKNADPWEGGRRLADLSHRGEVSEAAKELHRTECNVLATILWGWAVRFSDIYGMQIMVLVGSRWSFNAWLPEKVNLRNIYLSDPVPIDWLGVEWGKTYLLVGGTIRKNLAWIYPLWPDLKPQLASAWTSYQTSAQRVQDRMKIWSSSSSYFFCHPCWHNVS